MGSALSTLTSTNQRFLGSVGLRANPSFGKVANSQARGEREWSRECARSLVLSRVTSLAISNGELASRLRECRPDRSKIKTLLLQRGILSKFHLVEGQNARDQVTTDKRFKRSSSEFILCISLTLSGSLNECWLHSNHASVTITWRLGLYAFIISTINL